MPSDSQPEVWFRHFRCFQVALSDKLYRKDDTTLGTVAVDMFLIYFQLMVIFKNLLPV